MSKTTVSVPDLGGADNVDVIEISVAVGDAVELEQDLIVLETDKASMEIPSPVVGTVVEILVAAGDKVSEGDDIMVVEVAAEAATEPAAEAEQESAEAEPAASPETKTEAPTQEVPATEQTIELTIPDLGGATDVDVIELSVEPGAEVAEEESLLVLETDKASMDVPAPKAGTLVEFRIQVGDKVNEGDVYAVLKTTAAAQPVESAAAEQPAAPAAKQPPAESAAPQPAAPESAPEAKPEPANRSSDVYAGPSSRRLARQLGVDLTKVNGSGVRGRITKDDIRTYVKKMLKQAESGSISAASGAGIPPIPEVDFSQFGDIELQPMSKIKKLTAANMQRNWLNVPHVTQFDEADITDLDAFRQQMKPEAEKQGVKITPLPFLIKAAAQALKLEPSFNVSLHADGEHLVHKHYVHIGIAVDTPAGLMVPVIRDADKKGIWELARESNELVEKARAGKLKPNEMKGACFTISSLGAMGGTGFTPIVNAPEVAIMGVSKAQIKPVWNGKEFEPRNMLPLAVSYDHRAINGADCGRFFTTLVALISDIRRLIL
ncbi:acetyltransferase component of pyruvate dehydrogenase complex [Bacterioplanes sanyensis]|uniref:dihydrolipoyllysine-residue acetyltransferase n=1 Tax=Bacterioplanes sanyensis TaxID=1249553 RepID=UPI0016761111|nr:dihydrolipoyllysine-residue acetyltransferase [Bacterioplanes sanyensis]GGY42589.1 acetyltransferase component of pyruvate dehydrogenase complex [Bacterioplanes sanyensis]